MEIEYDVNKNNQNTLKHEINFNEVLKFDWENAFTIIDNRIDYQEKRLVSYGLIDKRLFVVCYVVRHNKFRIISLRKANKREVKYYEKQTAN